MQEKLYIIEDYTEKNILFLTAEDGVDMDAQLEKAVALAKADNVEAYLSTIPDQYLEKVGLQRKNIAIKRQKECRLFETALEKAGIYHAQCRHCISFNKGYCLKHSKFVDPSENARCCHGMNIYGLGYDDGYVEFFFLLHINLDDQEPEEIAELIQNEFPEVREILNSKRYDPCYWMMYPVTRA